MGSRSIRAGRGMKRCQCHLEGRRFSRGSPARSPSRHSRDSPGPWNCWKQSLGRKHREIWSERSLPGRKRHRGRGQGRNRGRRAEKQLPRPRRPKALQDRAQQTSPIPDASPAPSAESASGSPGEGQPNEPVPRELDVDMGIPGDRGASSPVKNQHQRPSSRQKGASPASQEVRDIMANLAALEVGSPVSPVSEETVESSVSFKEEWWNNPVDQDDPLEPSAEALLGSNPWEHTEIPLDFLQELGLMQE